jgi:hypothetical protein
MRQRVAWERTGVTVVHRPLRYPHDWPTTPEQEKGIDVQLAIDFVRGYMHADYDVGVLFSFDTDLLPALEIANEVAASIKGALAPEVSSWGRGGSSGRRLRPEGIQLHCHWLGQLDYAACEDSHDYNTKV